MIDILSWLSPGKEAVHAKICTATATGPSCYGVSSYASVVVMNAPLEWLHDRLILVVDEGYLTLAQWYFDVPVLLSLGWGPLRSLRAAPCSVMSGLCQTRLPCGSTSQSDLWSLYLRTRPYGTAVTGFR